MTAPAGDPAARPGAGGHGRATRAIRNPRDFWAGVLFVAAAVAFLVLGRRYPVGTAASMGPGYFPRVLGGILAVLGLLVALRAIRPAAARVALPPVRVRPVAMVLLSVVAFGLALPKLGLVTASMLVVVLSRTAGSGFRWVEVLLLGAGLTGLCAAIFAWGLKLPMTLWPAFLGG